MTKKKKVVPFQAKKTKNSEYDQAKALIEKDLSEGVNPYSVAPFAMLTYLNIKMKETPIAELADLYEAYMPDKETMSRVAENDPEFEQNQIFYLILGLYYLLENKNGQKIFREVIEWAPFPSEKKELSKWPTEGTFSLFTLKTKNKQTFYHDELLGKDFPTDIPADQVRQVQTMVPNHGAIQFIGLVPPLDPLEKTYDFSFTIPVLFEEKIVREVKQLAKDEDLESAQHYLFALYKISFEAMIHNEDVSPFTEESFSSGFFETSFIPLNKLAGEKNLAFAKRLTSLDPQLVGFPYLKEMQRLLARVIKTFPKLFIERANAVPLIEAMKDIFTDVASDPDDDDLLSDDVYHFWKILIETHLADDIAEIVTKKVSIAYWRKMAGEEEDYLDYMFDGDDDITF